MAMIGLVGPFGSGCTYVAKAILVKELGYQYISLSDILREEYRITHEEGSGKPERSELQDFGDSIREKNGADYLARRVSEKMKEFPEWESLNFVIDSIRNPEEVRYLKAYMWIFL